MVQPRPLRLQETTAASTAAPRAAAADMIARAAGTTSPEAAAAAITTPEAVATTAAADPTTDPAADMTAEGETITPLVGVTNAVVVTEMIIIAAPPLPLRGRLRQEVLPPPDHAPEVQAPELHKPLTLDLKFD